MKTTENFKKVIQDYLQDRALTDSLFGEKFNNPEKNIDDCITYILNSVRRSGCNGFTDDEVYSMAVHYYDEDKIDAGESIDCKVIINQSVGPANQSVELTADDLAEAKRKAFEKAEQEAYERLTKRHKKTVKEDVQQQSLFSYETVEVSLSKAKVVQSRSACNKNSEYHDRIIELVNNNIHLIMDRISLNSGIINENGAHLSAPRSCLHN